MSSLPGGMDITTMLSSQIITMTGMKDGNIMNAIYGIILLTLFNKLVAAIPAIWTAIMTNVNSYLARRQLDSAYNAIIQTTTGVVKLVRTGTIRYEKHNDTTEGVLLQSLIHYISGLKSSKVLVYNIEYYVINQEEFLLKPDIFCKVNNFAKDDKGKVTNYVFEIYSYVYDIEYLKEFVGGIMREYQQERSNNLGKQPYFFNEIYMPVPMDPMTRQPRLETANKHINFDMSPFYTNKSLKNVFGSHLAVVKKRVDMFINNPRWYEEKGIPYTLGILLSGPPGTGKTSLIKAIAKDTKRHIFNISLRESTTQTQLRNLFFDSEVRVLKNGRSEVVNIPLEKRIYVIEDIDCLTDVVLDRTLKHQEADARRKALSSPTLSETNSETETESMTEDVDDPNYLTAPETITKSDNFSLMGALHPAKPFKQNNNIPQNMVMHGGLLDDGGPNGFSGSSIGNSMWAASCMAGDDDLTGSRQNPANTKSPNKMDAQDTQVRSPTKSQTASPNKTACQQPHMKMPEPIGSPEMLNLSFLLNLLDGVLETPGRIIIATSNHPERLDRALIRPGRIDIKLEVGFCTRDMVVDMCRYFYDDNSLNITDDEWKYDKKITPAEMNKIMLNNFDNFTGCLAALKSGNY
jgi:hypothetical protein